MTKTFLLALHLGGAAVMAAASPALAQTKVVLPPGPGHDTVASVCAACHELDRLSLASYDRQEWGEAVSRMIAVGAPVPPDKRDEVVAYLANSFPDRGRPAGVRITGPVKVAFKEWTVPTPGSRPHDPLGAADGSLWWTGQFANKIGRLDPATGQMKEYEPEIPRSGPHGLKADKAGNIWFTANFQGYIGKLDPKTGKTVAYMMPDPAARDPHTLEFDQKGTLWFTVQNANMVGRLDTATGDIKLAKAPHPKTNPYGLVITSKGVPVFDLFGTNAIGAIDPGTMAIREYRLPDPDSRPRRIAITSDDTIWYTDFSRGKLGKLDLQSGKVTEYKSPGGVDSQPYAITALHDVIWYVESNTKPNMLMRFDPKTAKFQSWPIPSGGGVVRNMMATREGGLAMAESALNKVAIASIR